jgi:hypothetical protein
MINEKLLHQFWSPNIYKYITSTNKILIRKSYKKNIFICTDVAYNIMKEKTYLSKRKNCLTITKNPNEIEIYLHIDYIKSIIRNKLLTNILNNV